MGKDKVHPKPIRLIAAACNDMGIGKDGQLPWNIPKEFQFFLDTVTSVSSPGKSNLLIWGRKCWLSSLEITHLFRNCLHIVLSRTLSSVPKHADYVCQDFPSAVELASTFPLCNQVETIWIIGGVEVYKESARHPWCDLIYLTHVMADFDCDTYFPEFDREVYEQLETFHGVPTGIQEDCGIKFKFQVFRKIEQ
ncbi:dihydrofolate reductase isoform X2 [Amia ocellicauda]|uniref:dihydrofolate reductase isoform X2 n=1 Tax=Amia ocellicauda TaxID=2972642 RepID=UPI003463D510|nr:DYR reductase [Amia calva]